jgi:hypothetical protein
MPCRCREQEGGPLTKMGLGTFIRRLFGRPGEARDDYVRSTIRFMELDVERIKKRLDLEAQGRKRGERNQPAANNEGLDDVEQKVIATIDAERKLSHQKFIDNRKSYSDRIRSLGLEGLIAEAASVGDGASADFRAAVHGGADVLFQLRRDVVLIDDEIEEFKRRHGLRRMAHYPRSRTLRWGFVLVLLLIEAVLNGAFLARGHEFGLTGGVAYALAIALLNIMVGLWIGWKVVPNVVHRNPLRKLAGAALAVAYLVLVTGFNLTVAHYRDALGGDFPERAAELAWQTVWADPLGVASVESWWLFAMGLGFSLLAAGDGWTMDDSYPGYGKLARQQTEVIEEYVEQKRELMYELERIRDGALETLAGAGRNIERRRSEYHRIVESRKGLKEAFGHHLDHLEHTANYLLASYRRANEAARSAPAPAHFGKSWELSRPPEAKGGDEPDQGANTDARVEKGPERASRSEAAHSEGL